jgi:hypothetical protein
MVDNYPGLPSVSGRDLLEMLEKQAAAAGAERIYGRALSAMSLGESFGVSVGSDFHEAKALILCTGISQGSAYPGEQEFLGRGVSYCATCDGMLYRGKKVAVIGLCADAPDEAECLRSIGCEVYYFDRVPATACWARTSWRLCLWTTGKSGGRRVHPAQHHVRRQADAAAGDGKRHHPGGRGHANKRAGVFAAATASEDPSRSPRPWARGTRRPGGSEYLEN